ncbi:hypothetical protein ACQ0MK_06395 [Thalassospira lucentensis]|uniref:hypothetical protein n=1 Tax=Thalassospira lucentensis TaxID=168935 RepID=UPI003D2EF487
MPEKMTFYQIVLGAGLAVGSSSIALIPAMAHGIDHNHDHVLVEIAQGGGIFSEEERRIIKEVLDVADVITGNDDSGNNGGKDGKGGKGSNKGLPPGIAMKLERGGSLPPGIAKRDLPSDLQARLPGRTDNAIRQIVGDDVVLIERGTDIILDIMRGVVRN